MPTSAIWNKQLTRTAVLIVGLSLLAAGCNKQAQPETPMNYIEGTISLAGQTLNIDVANTSAERSQGLSNRPEMPEGAGMLFVFEGLSRPAFWMKDMRFPLDLIWIQAGQVVEITTNVPADASVNDSDLKRYVPEREVDSVLEVNAGWAAKHGLKVGDRVETRFNP